MIVHEEMFQLVGLRGKGSERDLSLLVGFP